MGSQQLRRISMKTLIVQSSTMVSLFTVPLIDIVSCPSDSAECPSVFLPRQPQCNFVLMNFHKLILTFERTSTCLDMYVPLHFSRWHEEASASLQNGNIYRDEYLHQQTMPSVIYLDGNEQIYSLRLECTLHTNRRTPPPDQTLTSAPITVYHMLSWNMSSFCRVPFVNGFTIIARPGEQHVCMPTRPVYPPVIGARV